MRKDDPRHGTPAGYSKHRYDGETACQACRTAASKASNRQASKYATSGYDPRDGLSGGRWMWDDRRAIRVWVETDGAA